MNNITLSPNLKNILKTDLDYFNLSEILQDEEYIDEYQIPIRCFHCESENLEKYYKVEFITIKENYKNQILNIYPDMENVIITFWVCKDCDEVVAIKLYTHKSHQEKKIYYSKFDSFHEIIKHLKKQGHLEKDNEPCSCWYCNSDKIEIISRDDRKVAICQDCKKLLASKIEDIWMINPIQRI